MNADLDFFFDPICPWAWITSRWVAEVQSQRSYDVSWKFISLRMVNAERGYTNNSQYEAMHNSGLQALRVASAARAIEGNAGVAAFYTALGTALHLEGRRELIESPHEFLQEIATTASLPKSVADAFADETHDEVIRFETEIALGRTGKEVGTPILTFNPKASNEASLFGPVISSIPRGTEATKLWDAVQTIAELGVAEIKRSLRAAPKFD